MSKNSKFGHPKVFVAICKDKTLDECEVFQQGVVGIHTLNSTWYYGELGIVA
jgi:hypothetical protein